MTTSTATSTPAEGASRDPLVVGFAALLMTLPFVRPSVLHIGGAPAMLPDLALVAMWTAAGIAFLRGRLKLRFDALFFATAAYIVVLGLSAVFGEGTRSGLLKLSAYSLYLLLPWLGSMILRTDRDVVLALKGFLVGAALVVVLELVGVAGFYLRVDNPLICRTYGLLPGGNYPRMCVTFATPNMLADFLILTLCAVLGAAPLLAGRRRLLLAGLGAIFVGAIFTLSAGFGGFVLAFVIIATVWLRERGELTPTRRTLLALFGAAACVFFFATMIAGFVPKGTGHIDLGSRGVRMFYGSRWSIWSSALDTWRAHPLLGKGYGNWVASTDDPTVFLSPDRLATVGSVGFTVAHLEAHQIWLNVAGQAGALGLVSFCAMIYVLARRITMQVRVGATLPYLAVALSAGFIAAIFYHGLVGALEESRNLWGFLALFVASTAPRRAPAPAAAMETPAPAQ